MGKLVDVALCFCLGGMPLFLMGCGTPRYSYIYHPFTPPKGYKRPQLSLAEKEKKLFQNLVYFVAPEGHLVYIRKLPLKGPPQPGHYGSLADSPFWTGALLGALALRWRITRDKKTLALAQKLLLGLHNLQAVTGKPGLLARFLDKTSHFQNRQGTWRASPALKWRGYAYKNDVSKDQYVGTLFGYLMAYLHLPLNSKLQALVRRDVVAIAYHLIYHNYHIVDITGRITRFGNLQGRIGGVPVYLNSLIDFFSLLLALEVAPQDQKLKEAYQDLLRWKYHKLWRYSKFQILGNTNPNNDNMAFFCFYGIGVLLKRTPRPELQKPWEESIDYLWSFIRAEGNSLWNFMYCALRRKDEQALQDAIWQLQLYPEIAQAYSVDVRNVSWIEHSVWPDRKGRAQARYALPLPLRGMSSFIWKSSPYTLISRDNPIKIYSGTDYLLAYWLGRYHQYILPSTSKKR